MEYYNYSKILNRNFCFADTELESFYAFGPPVADIQAICWTKAPLGGCGGSAKAAYSRNVGVL